MSRSMNSLGSAKITLQTAILGCEKEDAFNEAKQFLLSYIKKHLPQIDKLYFPVEEVSRLLQQWLYAVDTVGESCIVRIIAETDNIVITVKPVRNFMDEPDFKLLCVFPIMEESKVNCRNLVTSFKY